MVLVVITNSTRLLIYCCIHTTMATTLSCACEPYTKNRKPVNCGNVANLTSGYTR